MIKATLYLRAALCVLFGLVAGCATTVTPHMPPPPMVYQLERVDLQTPLPEALRTTKVPVFYATTREPAPEGEPGHYVNAYDKNLRLGVARVALGEPGWTWQDLVASDRARRAQPGQRQAAGSCRMHSHSGPARLRVRVLA